MDAACVLVEAATTAVSVVLVYELCRAMGRFLLGGPPMLVCLGRQAMIRALRAVFSTTLQ